MTGHSSPLSPAGFAYFLMCKHSVKMARTETPLAAVSPKRKGKAGMKVSGLGSGQKSDRSKKTGKVEPGRSDFRDSLSQSVDSAEGAEDARGVDSLSSIAGVDTLLALQSVGDVNEREARRRLVRRGEDILDKLEELRHGLLIGTMSKDKLEGLARTVRVSREDCADPGLGSILDEIELRAEVELAKLARFGAVFAA